MIFFLVPSKVARYKLISFRIEKNRASYTEKQRHSGIGLKDMVPPKLDREKIAKIIEEEKKHKMR